MYIHCKSSPSPLCCPAPDTTREAHPDEDPNSFYFVKEDDMRAEIMRHKFIEFGKHQQHLYGIKADSVQDVIQGGKMCIMDVHPQVNGTDATSGSGACWLPHSFNTATMEKDRGENLILILESRS